MAASTIPLVLLARLIVNKDCCRFTSLPFVFFFGSSLLTEDPPELDDGLYHQALTNMDNNLFLRIHLITVGKTSSILSTQLHHRQLLNAKNPIACPHLDEKEETYDDHRTGSPELPFHSST